MQKTSLLILSLATSVSAGCASQPPPTDQLANAVAATRGAEEAGARRIPQAALQLKLAEEQIAKARALISDDENERASLMALRASNDAELAVALARESAARTRAAKASAAASNAAAQTPGPGERAP